MILRGEETSAGRTQEWHLLADAWTRAEAAYLDVVLAVPSADYG